MKTINLKNAIYAGLFVYSIGITFFIGSYYAPLIDDPELQSNLILAIVIIPVAMLGAMFYYHKSTQTHGLLVGLVLFLIAGILDALITVPIFFIPEGGNHFQFFTNPWFWCIGLEYVLSVYIYSYFRIAKLNNLTR
ncbi:DUF5367 family protein [Kordia sp.]|uniref:DUF5367 family protein n=1 Tax=Kordia sp. TaxID=1965332 RepID=UPI003D27FD15